jgi:hypothetical protein
VVRDDGGGGDAGAAGAAAPAVGATAAAAAVRPLSRSSFSATTVRMRPSFSRARADTAASCVACAIAARHAVASSVSRAASRNSANSSACRPSARARRSRSAMTSASWAATSAGAAGGAPAPPGRACAGAPAPPARALPAAGAPMAAPMVMVDGAPAAGGGAAARRAPGGVAPGAPAVGTVACRAAGGTARAGPAATAAFPPLPTGDARPVLGDRNPGDRRPPARAGGAGDLSAAEETPAFSAPGDDGGAALRRGDPTADAMAGAAPLATVCAYVCVVERGVGSTADRGGAADSGLRCASKGVGEPFLRTVASATAMERASGAARQPTLQIACSTAPRGAPRPGHMHNPIPLPVT